MKMLNLPEGPQEENLNKQCIDLNTYLFGFSSFLLYHCNRFVFVIHTHIFCLS